MREEYNVTIASSNKELTARERIKIKDTADALSIDQETAAEAVEITPDVYALLDIHNEKSEDKDYRQLVIIDTAGEKWYTGSPSFIESFLDIAGEMEAEGTGEIYTIKAFRRPSKNYSGKTFLTCSIK
jgi:hypothetical protein